MIQGGKEPGVAVAAHGSVNHRMPDPACPINSSRFGTLEATIPAPPQNQTTHLSAITAGTRTGGRACEQSSKRPNTRTTNCPSTARCGTVRQRRCACWFRVAMGHVERQVQLRLLGKKSRDCRTTGARPTKHRRESLGQGGGSLRGSNGNPPSCPHTDASTRFCVVLT